jgi:hypothetical protein
VRNCYFSLFLRTQIFKVVPSHVLAVSPQELGLVADGSSAKRLGNVFGDDDICGHRHSSQVEIDQAGSGPILHALDGYAVMQALRWRLQSLLAVGRAFEGTWIQRRIRSGRAAEIISLVANCSSARSG